MSYLTTNNADVFYRTWGESGPWVTLINGYLRSHTDFNYLARSLVESGYRVISLDNRGSGKTRVNGRFEISDLAEDVVAVWSHLGCEKVNLLGISMGGAISQYVAATAQERIDKLILVSTSSSEGYITEGEGWLFKTKEEAETLDKATARHKFEWYFSPEFVKHHSRVIDVIVVDFLRTLKQEGYAQLAVDQRNAIVGRMTKYELSDIRTETLILHGSDDRIITPKASEEISGQLCNSTLKIVDGVGHLLLVEKPKELLRLILEFLK